MITVRNLMQRKGHHVWQIEPHKSIFDALRLMTQKDIGALPVVDSSGLVGIISERDIIKLLAQEVGFSAEKDVAQVMTKEVITANPDSTIEDCMQLMTTYNIRHLPVLESDALIGIVSIGDVIKAFIDDRDETISHLEDYISGPGYIP